MVHLLRCPAVVFALLVGVIGLSGPASGYAASDPIAVAKRAVAVLTQPPVAFTGGDYGGDDGLTRWEDDHPIDNVIAFGHVLHVAGRADMVDSSGPRFLAAEYRRAFPDMVLTVQGVDLVEDRVEVRWSLRGTSLGTFAGLAPTGRPHEESGTFTFRIAGGQVTETWVEAQTADLLRRAGAESLPAETPRMQSAPEPQGPGAPFIPVIEDDPYAGS